jgi:hypothetical protein
MQPLILPAPFADMDAIRCLFTEATPTRSIIEDNIRAGGYNEAAHLLFERLVSLGLAVPALSNPRNFRLSTDITILEQRHAIKPASAPLLLIGPRFSVFRGGITTVKPTEDTTPAALYAELISERLRPQTERLRAVGRKAPEFARLKAALDYVTPGGCFSRRAETGLVNASGLIVLDFDKLPDVGAARAALLSDPKLGPAVVLLFTSPSGDGLKCLLPTDSQHTHRENFNVLSRYLTHKYAALGLVPDDSGKDVSRACFLAHDSNAYLNPIYQQHPSKLAA